MYTYVAIGGSCIGLEHKLTIIGYKLTKNHARITGILCGSGINVYIVEWRRYIAI